MRKTAPLAFGLITVVALAQSCGGSDNRKFSDNPDASAGSAGAAGSAAGSGGTGGSTAGSAGSGTSGSGGSGGAGATAGSGADGGTGGGAGTSGAGGAAAASGASGSGGAGGGAGSAGTSGAAGTGGGTGGIAGTAGGGGVSGTGGAGGVPGADARCPDTANQCDVNGNFCCWEDPTASCIPDSNDCQGVPITCDGNNDCPTGEICCYVTSLLLIQTTVSCRTTCETTGSIVSSITRRPVCNPASPFSCGTFPGTTCQPQPGLPASYNTCQ